MSNNEYKPKGIVGIINDIIARISGEGAKVGGISDGYHTFDELYEFRKLYNAALFNEWAMMGINGVHKSKCHSDGQPCFGGGWFIVVAMLPTGQISNHYPMSDWELFKCVELPRAYEYDGHTPNDVMERLSNYIKSNQL